MIAQTSNISKAEINSFLFVFSVQLYDCFYLYANSIGNKKRTKFPPSALPFIYLSNPIFFRHGHHHRHGFHHGHRRVRKDHTPENLAVQRSQFTQTGKNCQRWYPCQATPSRLEGKLSPQNHRCCQLDGIALPTILSRAIASKPYQK